MHRPRLFAPAIMAAISSIVNDPADTPATKQRRYRRLTSRYTAFYRPNGARECQRRIIQISRGELTPANGLVQP